VTERQGGVSDLVQAPPAAFTAPKSSNHIKLAGADVMHETESSQRRQFRPPPPEAVLAQRTHKERER
jgi:hypothetical protein